MRAVILAFFLCAWGSSAALGWGSAYYGWDSRGAFIYAYDFNEPTREAAEKSAFNKCFALNTVANSCRPLITVKDQCVAVVKGRVNASDESFVEQSDTLAPALNSAFSACMRRGLSCIQSLTFCDITPAAAPQRKTTPTAQSTFPDIFFDPKAGFTYLGILILFGGPLFFALYLLRARFIGDLPSIGPLIPKALTSLFGESGPAASRAAALAPALPAQTLKQQLTEKKGGTLEEALRDFDAFTKQPVPAAPQPEQVPAFNPTLPKLPPEAHMRAAHAYQMEVETALNKGIIQSDTIELFAKIDTAAQHATRAASLDPELKITVGEGKDARELSQNDLAAEILFSEGITAKLAAELWRGYEQTGYKHLKRAQSAFERAITYSPYDPDLYYRLALIHKHLGDKEAALRAANRTLELYPSHVEAIKFIDTSGDDWKPLWVNIPPPPPPRDPIPFHWSVIPIGLGVLLIFSAPSMKAPGATHNEDVYFWGIIGGAIALFGLWRLLKFLKGKLDDRDTWKALYQTYKEARWQGDGSDHPYHYLFEYRYNQEKEAERDARRKRGVDGYG
jgi:tetratricopeptide (TPR) repeat protein